MPNHDHDCAYGHDHGHSHNHAHHHAHGEDCACGHDHNHHEHAHHHEHSHDCACGHDHSHGNEVLISEVEFIMLAQLSQGFSLPVARFTMSSTAAEHTTVAALAPVYLNSANDSSESINEYASVLLTMEDKGLLTFDYEKPVENYDYKMYLESDIYKFFLDTVEEGKNQEGFLFDTPAIDLGSISLTELGMEAVRQLGITEL